MQFHGAPVDARDLICQDCVNGLDISYAEEMEIISVAVSQDLIRSRLSQLWQTDASALLTRTLRFTSAERASQVNRFLRKTIGLATSPAGAPSTPQQGRSLENDLLNALLCNLEEPRPPEGAIARRWLAAGRQASSTNVAGRNSALAIFAKPSDQADELSTWAFSTFTAPRR